MSQRNNNVRDYSHRHPVTHAVPSLLHHGVKAHRLGRLTEAECSYRALLRTEPNHVGVLHLLALVRASLKHYEEADCLLERVLKIVPNYARALCDRGVVLQALERHQEALTFYDKALVIKPDFAAALSNRGVVLQALGRHEEALASYEKALVTNPEHPEALNNRGTALEALRRYEDALACYDRALAIKPDYSDAFNNRGTVLRLLDRREEALSSYDKALVIGPSSGDTLHNRGILLEELGRYEEALAVYNKLLTIKSDDNKALVKRGNVLRKLGCYEAALASYDEALATTPKCATALYNRGVVLQDLTRYDEALASYDGALSIKPDFAEALNNRGLVLVAVKRCAEAIDSYSKAIEAKPGFADALYNRGNALRDCKRYDDAIICYERTLALEPSYPRALEALAWTILYACGWTRAAGLADRLKTRVRDRTAIINPVTMLCYDQDQLLQLECARTFAAHMVPSLPPPLWQKTIWRNDKIRVAYLSADFRQHATAVLIAELIELHSRSCFEVLGISFGADDSSQMRARLVKAFDQFCDVRTFSDYQVAKQVNELRVDIAVDLMGYTTGCRPGILAHRPAPIQVNYLGYPGTMAVDCIDYIIADDVVLPFDQQAFYREKIVHLPDTFQVNDSKRHIGARTPTRQEAGLPDRGFVFCCFNNNWKIAAPVFDIWMRLLCSVEGSVLWLLRDNDAAARNLRAEALARGIDPSRLVFADRTDLDAHLARHRLADLFLDTVPVNAGTTASDALWAGLPVLTCCAGPRIAASLLRAIGLPEMVASGLDEYERLALRLARDAALIEAVGRKLRDNRMTYPLFDTKLFRDHIEAAYTTMWELWQRGQDPQSFRVRRKGETGMRVGLTQPSEVVVR